MPLGAPQSLPWSYSPGSFGSPLTTLIHKDNWTWTHTLLTSVTLISWSQTFSGLTGLPRYRTKASTSKLSYTFVWDGHWLAKTVKSLYPFELPPTFILKVSNALSSSPSTNDLTSYFTEKTGSQGDQDHPDQQAPLSKHFPCLSSFPPMHFLGHHPKLIFFHSLMETSFYMNFFWSIFTISCS